MAQNSKIEWTNHTVNLWHGCTKVHAGCDHCYAETLSKRWGRVIWGNDSPRMEIKSAWDDLDKYQKLAAASGEMHRVFVGSMKDIFEKDMPMINSKGEPSQFGTDYLRTLLFEAISDYRYPNLMFLFLTKRPGNINKMIPPEWKENPPANVMFGTSPVDEETSTKLVFQLLQVKGKRFLSIEPQLDEVDFYKVSGNWTDNNHPWRNGPILQGIDWVICGGESGHGRRPFNTDWARLLRDQCRDVSVPFFMKQIDKVLPIPEDLLIRQFPDFSKK